MCLCLFQKGVVMLKLNLFMSQHHCSTHFLSRIATNWWSADGGGRLKWIGRESVKSTIIIFSICKYCGGEIIATMLGLDVSGWFYWYSRGGRAIQRWISWQQCTKLTRGSKSLDRLQSNERKQLLNLNCFFLSCILIPSLPASLGISHDGLSTWKLVSHEHTSTMNRYMTHQASFLTQFKMK